MWSEYSYLYGLVDKPLWQTWKDWYFHHNFFMESACYTSFLIYVFVNLAQIYGSVPCCNYFLYHSHQCFIKHFVPYHHFMHWNMWKIVACTLCCSSVRMIEGKKALKDVCMFSDKNCHVKILDALSNQNSFLFIFPTIWFLLSIANTVYKNKTKNWAYTILKYLRLLKLFVL